MRREQFIHFKQDEAFDAYRGGLAFSQDIEKNYEEYDYKMRQPDLLGKTVRVNEKQFPKIYAILVELAKEAQMECPPLYVYEEFYYGAESYGMSKPWIEISAKTIQDFTEDELKFILARELFKIADGITKQRVLMEERFKAIKKLAPDEAEQVSKLTFYHWYRLANFSADNYGYVACGSTKTAVQSILKTVLNSIPLAEQVDVKSFIGQASDINRYDDVTSNYTKADEPTPYAPHRIQNLLAYAVSERGLEAVERKVR